MVISEAVREITDNVVFAKCRLSTILRMKDAFNMDAGLENELRIVMDQLELASSNINLDPSKPEE